MSQTLSTLMSSARRKIAPTLTSTDYPDVDLKADLNEWYRTILSWVILASGTWEFQSDMETTNLVTSQVEYVLPTGTINLNRVEIKYPNSTSYVIATRLDDKSTSDAFQNAAPQQAAIGTPKYRVFDNSIFIYPAPTAGVTNGLAIEIAKDITDLASSGDVPNLNPLIQTALAVGAAYNFCASNEMPRKAQMLWQQLFGRTTRSLEPSKEALKTQIEDLAAQRDKSVRGRMTPRNTSYN